MNCDHARKVLDAYLDRELDNATHAQLTAHLSSCPDCSSVLSQRIALGKGIRELARHAPRAALHAEVMAALPRAAPASQRVARRVRWPHAAALACAVAVASFGLGLWMGKPTDPFDRREQVIARHVGSLVGGQPQLQVASSDRHVVKPWFAGKVDFAPPVRDLDAHGFTLLGARLDSVADRPAAALVYRIRKHEITLFVSRAAQSTPVPPTVTTLRGFAIAAWTTDGLMCTAISDVDPAELQRFVDLVQAPQGT